MHSLAGVLVCVGVHIELGFRELHCRVAKWREEISTLRQPCWEEGHQPQGRGWAGAGEAEEPWRCSTRNPKSRFGAAVSSEQFRTWLPRFST